MGTKEFQTLNRYLVGVQGDRVRVMALLDKRDMTNVSLTRDEAIMFAAWLISMADVVSTLDQKNTQDVREESILEEVHQAIEAIERA